MPREIIKIPRVTDGGGNDLPAQTIVVDHISAYAVVSLGVELRLLNGEQILMNRHAQNIDAYLQLSNFFGDAQLVDEAKRIIPLKS